MLAISPLENAGCHDGRGDGGGVGVGVGGGHVEENNYTEVVVLGDDNFSDAFSGGSLLHDIELDDLFAGFEDGDHVLPDLEIDPNELLGELSAGGAEDASAGTTSSEEVLRTEDADRLEEVERRREVDDKGSDQAVPDTEVEDVGLTRNSTTAAATNSSAVATTGTDKGVKSTGGSTKNAQGKRKAKVDWTPELHRRFVQAVEQLGIDKAVPSRILEIMGIDCLTRHNIASHLQKYRSHRKHLLAREAEAASWSHRRYTYGEAGGGHKREVTTAPWLAPTVGFPPAPHPMQPFPRPLHVWGHPTVDHAMMHMWPKHLVPSRPPPPPPHQWPPHHPPPHPDPSSFWHHPHHYPRGHTDGWLHNAPTTGTPCYPHHQALPSQMRFPSPPVQGIPPPPPSPAAAAAAAHRMYRPDNSLPLPSKHLQLDLHPSKESIDAAIGDVLSKPWLPLPLGLKPPSVDSVLGELQRQGIARIPPSCA